VVSRLAIGGMLLRGCQPLGTAARARNEGRRPAPVARHRCLPAQGPLARRRSGRGRGRAAGNPGEASDPPNDNGSAIVEVSDTGPSIPEDIRERIFDPFFTTKEVGRGTGQGLAIARSIVDKHGGSLTYQPAPGRGTKFVVRLPA